MFLFLGVFFIISNENISLAREGGVKELSDACYDWMDDLFSNMMSVVGYAVDLRWLPSNSSDEG